jgi:hypothetical protein
LSAGLSVQFLGVSVSADARTAFLKDLARSVPNVTSGVIDNPTYFGRRFRETGSDAFIFGLKANNLDGYEYLLPFVEDDASFTGSPEPELVSEIVKSQELKETGARAEAYRAIGKRVLEDCLVLPILSRPYRTVWVRSSLETPHIGEVPLNNYYLGQVR